MNRAIMHWATPVRRSWARLRAGRKYRLDMALHRCWERPKCWWRPCSPAGNHRTIEKVRNVIIRIWWGCHYNRRKQQTRYASFRGVDVQGLEHGSSCRLPQLFRLELQDPNARRRLRRLSQRLFTPSDHIAQEWVYIGPSTHGRSLLHS